ncbi:MAG: helix-turn-helix transcriptional regulator, partial [Alphaproteobacteria bacterium]|nr:helix-turn-helix transcriptional regulator [Alphaproteobacteria bacterium]
MKLLELLRRDGALTAPEIAKGLQVTPQHARRLVRSAEEAGAVRLVAALRDRKPVSAWEAVPDETREEGPERPQGYQPPTDGPKTGERPPDGDVTAIPGASASPGRRAALGVPSVPFVCERCGDRSELALPGLGEFEARELRGVCARCARLPAGAEPGREDPGAEDFREVFTGRPERERAATAQDVARFRGRPPAPVERLQDDVPAIDDPQGWGFAGVSAGVSAPRNEQLAAALEALVFTDPETGNEHYPDGSYTDAVKGRRVQPPEPEPEPEPAPADSMELWLRHQDEQRAAERGANREPLELAATGERAA